MPVQPTYPGVYIEEIASGVRTITGVATSITAFIGRARKGPEDESVQIFNFGDYERIFGGLWNKSPMSFAVRDFFLNGGGNALIVRVHNGATFAEIRLPTGGGDPNDEICLTAANRGSWGNKLSVQVDYVTKKPDDITLANTLFNISITEKDGAREKFFNVSTVSTDALYLPRVLEQNSNLVRVKKAGDIYVMANVRPLETTGGSITPASPPASPPMSPVAVPTLGSDGSHITDANIFSGDLKLNKKGMYALENADLFNLLCIPPYASNTGGTPNENDRATDVTKPLIDEAVKYCIERRAMFIVDPHSKWNTRKKASDQFMDTGDPYPGLTSNYSALFFPRLRQANPLMKNQIEEFVPCGAVAGIFARTDAQRGVWKAPAGQEATVRGVDSLTVPLTDDENGTLNQLGINCLRAFPVYGRLIWGARTLEGADRLASEWKYIPVRRTALFIEESLYRGTKWVVFEPNDESLWAQIRLNVGAFMHNLFRQGAFQGGSPKEAYFVKCDKETTTQNDINSGIVNIMVGFQPLKPAEFVMIKIQQMTGQIQS